MRGRLFLFSTSLLLAASVAQAGMRSPQVPVSGTALATFFASQGQSIHVNTDQLDLKQLSAPATTALEVRAFPSVTGVTLGLHNASGTSPKLYSVISSNVSAGSYARCAFQSSPPRLVVSVYDANNVLLGTNTYNGADRSAFSLYAAGPAGTFDLNDTRNAGGAAKILAFAGTGTRAGWTWFACETSAGPGGDYADFVALVNLSSATTPTLQTRWGELKQLFR